MTRTRKWLVGIAGCLLLLVAAVYFFDWNLARPYIARKVTSSTGRSFAINGDLEVRLSLRPRIIANDVVMGNAEWSKDPIMAQIKRADFRIDILKLLGGHLAFPELSLSEPHLVLEVNKDGTPNWVFDQRDKQREFPTIDALAIDRGTVKYRDPTINTDLALEINTLDATKGDPESMVELTGKGRFKGMQTRLQARGGALLALRSADRPYPIKATATLGTTKASVDGTLIDPLHLKGEEVNFQLEGSDLALLYPIVGVPIPPTPAYKLAGFLSHTGDIWTFKRFKGTVGKSDLTGDFSVDRGRAPQLITADLVSGSLDMKDLGGFIGADRGTKPSDNPPPGDKVLPTEPFSLEKLRAADADVRFKGARIITQKMPLEKMDTHLIVKDGTLKLAPLNFGIAGGNLVTEIAMDGRKSHIVTHADITAKGLHLDQLFPASKLNAASAGTMGGRAKLDATGNSMAQMLGTANGEAALIMDGGTVSELLLRLSNLDIANSIMVLLGGDKQVPIRCMVANFKAVEGKFKVQDLVLDTPKVGITGEGDVNFADESLHLRLVSQSKGFSLASLRGPIVVTGPFKNPSVHPDMGKVVARGGLAAGLGALTAGIGALIPLLEFGKDKDSNCAALMSQARSDAGIKQSDIAPRRPADR
ncbi:MAG TPA: AsmA family protein [Burkholderiales bacterium]|nr:AsmA family protein [Burkholderiales bacterium]